MHVVLEREVSRRRSHGGRPGRSGAWQERGVNGCRVTSECEAVTRAHILSLYPAYIQ